jgi:hypothetical protein
MEGIILNIINIFKNKAKDTKNETRYVTLRYVIRSINIVIVRILKINYYYYNILLNLRNDNYINSVT